MLSPRLALPIQIERFLHSDQRALNLRADAVQVLRQLPDESIDAFVSDPPYGIALNLGSRGNARSIAGDGKVEARKLWRAFVPEAYRAAKPDTLHMFFASYKSPWIHTVLSRHFTVRGCIIWNKRRIGLGYYLRTQWEMAYLCAKGKPPRPDKPPCDVWDESRVAKTRHVCEKPVPLMRRAVRLVTRPGAIVCDPFAGIASTGVAAILERCQFIGAEINAAHHRLGSRRVEEALGAEACPD